ncbi:MAG: hypothetical protein EOO56_01940 [Hymenobacter sp.]|nr:MAG: hypothetical protein EOO56_01940 [Hymenobacter sp.]
MDYIKQDRLENYVERHRADFDLHEPRPDLWAALETQLHGEMPAVGEPVMAILADEQLPDGRHLAFAPPAELAVTDKRWAWTERYSIVAALAVLILAAGLGEAWKSGQAEPVTTVATQVAPSAGAADAALYLAPAGGLQPNNASQNTNARLDTAVRGMETYYVSQLTDRKAELSQLDPAAAVEWTSQLVDLDSSYQQLKRLLPQHPQPEVVLTAMNRNLQVRLDILDRQLELRGSAQTAMRGETRGEYALADSRQYSEATLRNDR